MVKNNNRRRKILSENNLITTKTKPFTIRIMKRKNLSRTGTKNQKEMKFKNMLSKVRFLR